MNSITVNGVNVIVDKPKVGDIMCVTRYTDESGTLLPANSQKVIWIDGLSINPSQLSQKLEPVGICVVVNGNKAMVRYRQEKSFRWAASERWEIPYTSIMDDCVEHTLQITLNDTVSSNPFVYTASSPKDFVNKLNSWFLSNDKNYSAELVKQDTDSPATNTDITSGEFRIIINAIFTSDAWKTINIENIGSGTRSIGNHIKAINYYYFLAIFLNKN